MKQIPLTKGKFAIVDDGDYESLIQYKWHYNSKGYAVRCEYLGKIDGKYKQKTICMHRQILNAPPGKDVDHRNGNRLDNRKSNIRICTRSQNVMNTLRRGKYKGVSRFKNRYSARITVGGKTKFLGYFDSEEMAAQEYNKAAIIHHGEFAKLNEALV